MRVLNMICHVKNWKQYLLDKHFLKKDHFIFKCQHGVVADVPKRMMHTFKECFFDDGYFKNIAKNHFPEKSKLVIFDIGANVGYFSLFCHTKFNNPNVYAFEPIPTNLALLKKNKTDNPKLSLNIIEKAVAKEEGVIELYFDANDQFTTSASINENSHGSDLISVQCVTLEKAMHELKVEKIDLLKLDCEGSEFDILYHTPQETFERIGTIVMEVHQGKTEEATKAYLKTYLEKKGYIVKVDASDLLWAWRS